MSSPRQSRTPTGSPPPRRDRSERSRSPIRDRSSAPSPHFPWPETPITSGPSVPHHHHATPRGNAFTTFIVRRRGSQPTTDGQLPPSSAELQSGPPAPVGSLPDALAIPDLINDQSAGVDELDLDIRPFSPPPAFPLPPPGLFGIPSVGIRPAQTTASNDQNPEGPRMPWQGAIPSFFIMGGDGSLVPHFELPPQLQPHPHTILHNPADGPQRRPVEFFFPFGLAPAVPTAPDPEKAKERLRSLKGVQLRLMKRVDRIVLAEEDELEVEEGNEKGWKCGICLDGWESQDKGLDDEVGVKALPCNHLFHEQCLEPWFATNYTCPTCRLDLDPLHTLDEPIAPELANPEIRLARGQVRPPAFHPYPRPRGTTTSIPPPSAAPNISDPVNAGGDQNPSVTFVWRMPTRDEPRPAAIAPNGDRTPPLAAHLAPPRTPTVRFDLPLHASPLAMDDSASPRRPFASFLSQAPDNTAEASSLSQAPVNTAEAINNGSTQQAEEPVVDSSSGPPALESGSQESMTQTQTGLPDLPTIAIRPGTQDRPQPERRPHYHIVHHLPPFLGQNQTGLTPHFHFHRHAPAQPQPTSKSPPLKVVALEDWIAERETSLGWRCHAPVCLVLPSDEDAIDTIPRKEECGMMSIYAPVQPALEGGEQGFVLHACTHRWHRDCLVMEEKTSGRWKVEDGKVWLRCGRCRKDGWIPETSEQERSGGNFEDDEMEKGSEYEVEGIVLA